MNENIKRQYEGLYGPYVAGDYSIGSQVTFDAGQSSGEVIWSCLDENGQFEYVIDDGSGFPVELAPHEVIQSRD